jgi:hypothetical protein
VSGNASKRSHIDGRLGRFCRGRRITRQPGVDPIGAIANDSVTGVVDHQPEFFCSFDRNRHRTRRIVFMHDAAIENLFIIHINLKNYGTGSFPALPLDADLRLKSLELSAESHDDFSVGMVAQSVSVRLLPDAKFHGGVVRECSRLI